MECGRVKMEKGVRRIEADGADEQELVARVLREKLGLFEEDPPLPAVKSGPNPDPGPLAHPPKTSTAEESGPQSHLAKTATAEELGPPTLPVKIAPAGGSGMKHGNGGEGNVESGEPDDAD